MTITGSRLGKRFEKNWVFKDISFEIKEGEKWAIIGPNGSGKSTLLKIITGAMTASAGDIIYRTFENQSSIEAFNMEVSFSAPYIELPEEFSLIEFLDFHSTFSNSLIPVQEMIERIGYPKDANKLIGQYSSGMKQRVRLALNFYFDKKIVALDEPTSNLDENGIKWYQNELIEFARDKCVIISSNQRYEYKICDHFITLQL